MITVFFFFNDTATTEIYTLSLHDALPICRGPRQRPRAAGQGPRAADRHHDHGLAGSLQGSGQDRKSTRLNSSHANISYAVFCLNKKTEACLAGADRSEEHTA